MNLPVTASGSGSASGPYSVSHVENTLRQFRRTLRGTAPPGGTCNGTAFFLPLPAILPTGGQEGGTQAAIRRRPSLPLYSHFRFG